jgi:hypothetical protein
MKLCLKIGAALAIASALQTTPAAAENIEVKIVPTPWHLQNYQNNIVVVFTFGTTGNCSSLSVVPNWSDEDRNRFWSVVMTAKIARKEIFVYYDTSTCVITSFGMDG